MKRKTQNGTFVNRTNVSSCHVKVLELIKVYMEASNLRMRWTYINYYIKVELIVLY